jgi:glucosamine--fructose-6-phosphate aminotransferase (isomerizing)
MCGIVGYIGPNPPVPILLEGLRKLEYRGYDSAGIAVVSRSPGDGEARQLDRID